MLRVSMALVASLGAVTAAGAATVIPTVYEAGHFFATPTTHDGQRLRLLVDTGGGGATWSVLTSLATTLGLSPASCEGHAGFRLPRWAAGKGLPAPKRSCGLMSLDDRPSLPGGHTDGVISGWYLADQTTLTFDYPAHRLVVEDATWKADDRAHSTPIGLPRGDHHELEAPYPRITVTVDDAPIDLLLDTGATAKPGPEGLAAMRTQVVGGIAAGSYITTSVMNGWKQRHPEWPIVEGADDLGGAGKATRTIRVPSVSIAGWAVGPVWFTERSDANFKWMSGFMDSQVHGALGGNALDRFRMTIDYAHDKAYFVCEKACTASGAPARPVTF